jgi:hypothetical protein
MLQNNVIPYPAEADQGAGGDEKPVDEKYSGMGRNAYAAGHRHRHLTNPKLVRKRRAKTASSPPMARTNIPSKQHFSFA